MISVIDLVLSLLGTVLASAKVKGVPASVLADIQAAVDAVAKVQGTDVTYSQLESFRLTPKW